MYVYPVFGHTQQATWKCLFGHYFGSKMFYTKLQFIFYCNVGYLRPDDEQNFSVLVLWFDDDSISEPNLVARNTFTSSLLVVCDRQLNKHIFVILVIVIIIIFSKTTNA
jgi:hypothetical protein